MIRAHHVLWLSPSPPAERSADPVAGAVGSQAVIAAKDLEVWASEVPADSLAGVFDVSHVGDVGHVACVAARGSAEPAVEDFLHLRG
jgi:hypothetical protein